MKALQVFGTAAMMAMMSGALVGSAQELPFAEVLEGLLPGIGAANMGDREKPQQRLQNLCLSLGAPGREAQRAEACRLMAAKLGPETAKPARVWLLKQLQLIGRAESVDAVAALLADADAEIRDAARTALAGNPASEANAKLLARLSAADDAVERVALIHALGYRRDPASVEVLGRRLADADASVAAAAARALGKIANPDAAGVLAAARPTSPEVRRAIADARLRCAVRILKDAKTTEAAKLYQELSAPSQPRPIRLAALTGQLCAAGDRAPTMVLQWIQSDDADVRRAAAGHMGELKSPAAMAQLAAELPKLPAPSQIMLLSILVAKGDKSALPAARLAAKSENPEVRVAGLVAIAKLSDTSVVPLLIELALFGTPAAKQAREGLEQVSGAGVDEAIVAAMEHAALPARSVLIEVLEARGAVAAVPALLKEAEQNDARLRAEALRALGRLAAPTDIPALIVLALKTAKGRDREDVEKAIVLVCNMHDAQHQADPVLAAYSAAAKAERLALLPVLGRIGGPKALKVVKDAIRSGDAALADAGIRALCHWPDASVAGELLELAAGAANKEHRILALRAYVRVITTPAAIPDSKTLEALDKVMRMASRDEDKRLILSRSRSVRSAETVRWLLPYLDDKALAAEASKSIVDLARRQELFTPNRAEFVKALQKVIEAHGDPGAVEQAKRILQGF